MRNPLPVLLAAGLVALGQARLLEAQAPEPSGADTVPAPRFWHALGDTTLDRLMAGALRANQDVQAAVARVREARALRSRAVLDLVPSVTAAGGFTRQRIARATFPGLPANLPDQSIWDVGVDASWEVDLFGRLRQSVRAEGAALSAAREDVRGLQVAVAADLAQAYFDLRGAQEQLVVARRNAENQQRTLDVTRQRLDAGRGTAFDTERAQAQLSFTQSTIPDLEAQIAAAQHRIGVLIGRPPSAVATELAATAELPVLPASVEIAARDSLIRLRPDVAAAERRVAVEQALVKAARADYLPRLTIGATAGLASDAFDALGREGTFRYAAGPTLSWPLLNLGRVKAGVQASRARHEEAAARYAQTILLAQEELETAMVRYRSARTRSERIAEAAAASAHAAELARLRFSEGVSDFLQVLDAERTQLDAESQLARSRTDAAIAYAALYRALGGDTSLRR